MRLIALAVAMRGLIPSAMRSASSDGHVDPSAARETDRADLGVLRQCRTAVHVLAAVSAFISVGVLVGWALDITALKSVVPNLIAMNPLTALCFLTSAVAVELLRLDSRSQPQRVVGTVCAALVTAAGLARLAGYAAHWNIPIDQILFADRLNTGAQPNRMAPNTAFNFVLLGGALLLGLSVHRGIRVVQAMALICGSTAFLGLIGYLYSAASLTQIATYIPMALHTALNFICLASAVLCAVPEQGLMRRITRDSPGGRLLRGVVPVFFLVPAGVGWLRVQGERAGWYSEPFGIAIMVGSMTFLGVVLAWTNAMSMDHAELERQRVEQVTRRLAYFDGLTGLPNRALFTDRVTNALARAKREGGHVAVLFLDLDGFKGVNDSLGHDAGDELLRQAGNRLKSCVRETDTAARLAGDEFTAVLVGIHHVEEVDIVASRTLSALSKPYDLNGSVVHISASIGYSVAPPETGDALALIKKADVAMYAAKRAGKNRLARYVSSNDIA